MKKISQKLLLIIILCLIPAVLLPHPLDITFTEFWVDGKELHGRILIHPFEAKFYMKKSGIKAETVSDFRKHQETLFRYVSQNLKAYNNGKKMRFVAIGIPETQTEAEFMGMGLFLNFKYISDTKIDKVKFKITLFIEDFKLQTNKIALHLPDVDDDSEVFVKEAIMTAKITEYEYWFFSEKTDEMIAMEKAENIDTDQDGLTDQMEDLYGTDPENPDTDGDKFCDATEVYNGWDPLNPEWMEDYGQNEYMLGLYEQNSRTANYSNNKTSDTVSENDNENEQLAKSDSQDSANENAVNQSEKEQNGNTSVMVFSPNNRKQSAKDANQMEENTEAGKENDFAFNPDEKSVFEEGGAASLRSDQFNKEKSKDSSSMQSQIGLVKLLGQIENAMNSKNWWNKLFLFIPVFILGFLHALQAGHGKTILFSYMLDEKRSMKDAFLFTTFLSITHVLDIILLALALILFVNLAGDITYIMQILQKVGLVIISVIAIYTIYKGIRKIRSKGANETESDEDSYTDTDSKKSDLPQNSSKKKKQKNPILMGIITGLAPCTFGWAIFSLIVQLGKLEWIAPIIIVFALGIFVCLMIFALFITFVKNKAYKTFSGISKYSLLASGLIMLFFAIFLLISNSNIY